MTAGFAIILLGALVLSGVLSLLQQRAYAGATRRMAEAHKDRFGSVLISGRGIRACALQAASGTPWTTRHGCRARRT